MDAYNFQHPPEAKARFFMASGCEHDVSLGVADGGASSDVTHGARVGAMHDDGVRACLGCDQQVTRAGTRLEQLRAGQTQNAVGTRVLVSLGVPVGEVGGVVGAEPWWQEPGAFDAYVAAVRQARYRECDSGAIRPDGVHRSEEHTSE